MTDLERLLLGLPGKDADAEPVEELFVNTWLRRRAAGLLSLPCTRRGGPMVGLRNGSRVEVVYLLDGGKPWRVDHPMQLDPLYVLGALDAISQTSDLDWVGYWLCEGDSADLELARWQRWMTATRPLLTISHSPERPIIRAFAGGEEVNEIVCR